MNFISQARSCCPHIVYVPNLIKKVIAPKIWQAAQQSFHTLANNQSISFANVKKITPLLQTMSKDKSMRILDLMDSLNDISSNC